MILILKCIQINYKDQNNNNLYMFHQYNFRCANVIIFYYKINLFFYKFIQNFLTNDLFFFKELLFLYR